MKNYELYDDSEFISWSRRESLNVSEKYFFSKYLYSQDIKVDILDVGTGNGRFLFKLAKKGYRNLYGIDLAKKLLSIAELKKAKTYPFIKFYEMDASKLIFKKNNFGIVLALQQVISLIENDNNRKNALKECYRVLKPNGLFLASFLYYNGRWYNPVVVILSSIIKFIKGDWKFLRYQYLPWLKHGGKINYGYLYRKQSYIYWFKIQEIVTLLEKMGFKILEVKTSQMIKKNVSNFIPTGGMLYIICKK